MSVSPPKADITAIAPDRTPGAAAFLVVEHSAKIAHVEPAFKEMKLNPRRLMLTASERDRLSGPLF